MRDRLLSLLRAGAVVAGLLAMSGCETIGYYGQAIGGQVSIMLGREPLREVIAREEVDPATRSRLQFIEEIRAYAERELALPVGESYSTYVDTGRRYVVWNLFATPELSLVPERWCYPVVGCVTYRGYFDEGRARAYAERLREEGRDVHVGGVAAYSTLGWFSDPVLNTFLRRSDTALAALIFHEVAHQVCYVPDATRLNEGFATTVEIESVRRWLRDRGEELGYAAYLGERKRRAEFSGLVREYRQRLQALYESGATVAVKRTGKARLIEEFRAAYANLRGTWGEHGDFDAWVSGEINNAKLVSLGSYNDLVPALQRLLEESDGDLTEFGARCRALGELDGSSREAELARLEAAIAP